MSCTPLPKAAKPVWAKQLTRLSCLVVYVKSQLGYATNSKMGSQLLLASTRSHVQLLRGSKKAFNECLGVSNVQIVATYPAIVLWNTLFCLHFPWNVKHRARVAEKAVRFRHRDTLLTKSVSQPLALQSCLVLLFLCQQTITFYTFCTLCGCVNLKLPKRV